VQLQLDTFGNIGDQLRAEMDEYAQIITFTKKEMLFDADDAMAYFYIILGGKVKISQINFNNGKEQTIYLMSRGDMYDTVTLLDGKIHEVLVEILEEGSAMKIPIGKAREWMYDYPIFGEIVLKYVATQLRKVEELATDLTLFDTQERLIKLIVQSMESMDQKGKNILDGLSHTEIANLIGTVRHVVDRHIKKLKSDGVLEDKRRKISLKSREKLLDRVKSLF
jgi:CRP-like cAMP-binding protein